jgi:hypothetical protein
MLGGLYKPKNNLSQKYQEVFEPILPCYCEDYDKTINSTLPKATIWKKDLTLRGKR